LSDTATLARLRWRCRRGTRELDALFGWWLEARYAAADAASKGAFAELLEAQDPDLWDWVMARALPPREDWRAIIDAIRAQHRL
jgi:antitoxin CptB